MTVTTQRASCTLCEAMCGLVVTKDSSGAVTGIRGDEADPLSRGHLCPKAFALPQLQDDPDRLRRPLVRGADGELHEATWPEAFRRAAELLAGVQREHGDDALAVYLGNPNVHSLGALTHHPTLVRLLRTRTRFSATSVDQLPHHVVAHALYGHQFLLPVPDIDRTDLVVLVGHNPMASNGSLWTVPDFPGRRRELASRGGRLVVLDPRRTETARVADTHHFVRPGSDAAVLLALVREVLVSGRARPAPWVDGVDAVRTAVEPFTPELAERASGMPADAVRALARDLLDAPSAAVHGRMGASTQAHGVVCQWAVQLLNVLTGNLDRPGGTMLTTPAVDLVGRGVLSPGGFSRRRTRVRGLPGFGGELPVSALAEEIATPGEGRVRALLTIAGNPVSSTPGGHRLDAALGTLDALVCVDFYLNETTRHADVVLPPTGPLERDHYDLVFHLLAVRDTARFTSAVLPKDPGGRHDWEIARDLGLAYLRARGTTPRQRLSRAALALEARLRTSPTRQLDVLLRTGGAGLSVRRLRAAGPGGLDLGPLRPRLPGRLRTRDKRVDLATPLVLDALPGVLAALEGAATDGLVLVGRRHQRDNNSWLHNAPVLTKGRPRHALLVHPDDLVAHGLSDGERVRVTSAVGEVVVEAAASADVMPGVVSLPHGYGHAREGVRMRTATTLPGVSVNDLTDPGVVDPLSGNAVLSGVPVTLAPAEASQRERV
ncbi:molybdopterin-dependent oxidoreductase [Phycicoccus sp. MAQZ13P-2]|uniref:molybdopterin-dependent oxidoreductase n=1 Tax=Phycicoccus mangrovi TaxID=2840470 RepID=UPI001C0000AD|nr:molybdopterin-dependent oxidoreductase [Phycicoccus mangrovi]MBT9256589.1 molybdopterin-dependent oxidoreductase [Phycicoccus mangrovi]MBT9274847.1 molybdopterin-dependent oxidoreductase [Phycicoccus mangrovi]